MDRALIAGVHPQGLNVLSKQDQRRVAHEAISESLNQLQAAGAADAWERFQIGHAIALFVFWEYYIAAFNACMLAALPADEREYRADSEELATLEQLVAAWRSIPPGSGDRVPLGPRQEDGPRFDGPRR